MKKGRGCNLAAGIIDIILASFLIIAGIYYLIVGSAFMNSNDAVLISAGEIVFIAGLVGLLLGAGYLTFGILSIKYAIASPEIYYAKKRAYLTFSIIESVVVIYFIYSVIAVGDALAIISLLIYLSAMILHWVGFGLMAKGRSEMTMSNNGVTVELKQNASIPQTQEVETQKQSFNENVYAQLTKLNELKQNGIISEEEFQEMKNKILNK